MLVPARSPEPSEQRLLTAVGRTPSYSAAATSFSTIILGIILLIDNFSSIPILWTLGIVALVIGLILALLGAVGHAVGGRRHYW